MCLCSVYSIISVSVYMKRVLGVKFMVSIVLTGNQSSLETVFQSWVVMH